MYPFAVVSKPGHCGEHWHGRSTANGSPSGVLAVVLKSLAKFSPVQSAGSQETLLR